MTTLESLNGDAFDVYIAVNQPERYRRRYGALFRGLMLGYYLQWTNVTALDPLIAAAYAGAIP